MPAARTTAPKTDTVLTAAVEVAHAAAERQAGDFGVGEYLGCEPEGERLLTHHFACPHHGYRGWRWAVTLTRAPRARTATVDVGRPHPSRRRHPRHPAAHTGQ